MRKHNVKNINLQINDITPFINLNTNRTGFIIEWFSNIGFGEYTLYKGENGWYADSETIDCNEDKEFITELMRLFIEMLKIEV